MAMVQKSAQKGVSEVNAPQTGSAAELSSARHSPPLEESYAPQTGLAAELSSARHSPPLEEQREQCATDWLSRGAE